MDSFLKRRSDGGKEEERKSRKLVRKSDPDYIKYGFIMAGNDNEQKAQCVEYAKILWNESLKPSKLERHQNAHHPQSAMKPKEYFERKGDGLQAQQQVMTSFGTRSKSSLKASCMVARRVVCRKKAFTIADVLILASAIDMCWEVLGEAAASKLELVSLSSNTISSRIIEMSDDIECQLLERIKSSPSYSIQLDESTDFTNVALLLVFVRYCADGKAHDDLLFLQVTSHKNNCH